MSRFLLDTDHLTLFEQGNAALGARLAAQPPPDVSVSVVTAEEALRGRLAHVARARDGPSRITRYGFLRATILTLQRFPLVPFDQAAEDTFQQLDALRLRVGAQDLKIAAIALANGFVLLTRNARDFGRVPGLQLDDWSV